MSLDKLGGGLGKELTRNPKKSALLAGMVLVAFYFWAPLLLKWTKGESHRASRPSQQTGSTPVTATAQTATPAASPATPALPKLRWDELVKSIERDAFTKPALLPAALRDPFRYGDEQLAAQAKRVAEDQLDAKADSREKEDKELSPKQLDLVLGGTIIGPRQRVAMISGRAYPEKTTIRVGGENEEEDESVKTNGKARAEFILVKVTSSFVVLERGGKEYVLHLQANKRRNDLITKRP